MATEEKRKTTPDSNSLERMRKNVLKLLNQGRITDAFVLTRQGIEISNSLANPYYRNVFIDLLDEIEMANEKVEERTNLLEESVMPLEYQTLETSLKTDTKIEDPFTKERESSEFVERQRNTVIETLKNRGYSIKIPSHSRGVFKNIDLVAMKILRFNGEIETILIVPLKISQYKGVFMVDKEQVSYRLNIAPGQSSSSQTYVAHAILEDSLSAISNFSAFHDSFLEKKELYRIISKFTSNALRTKRSILLKPVYYYIGNVEQRLVIEPIFISSKVSFLDKQLNFGYQKFCNLRYCTFPQLSSMLEYLEQKIEVLGGNSPVSASENYSNISRFTLLCSRIASIIVIAAIISSFIGVYVNLVPLDLFAFIGTGLFLLYLFAIVGLFIFMSFKSFKLARLLKTPHWKLILDNNDPVMFRAQSLFSTDLLKQFQYETAQKITESSEVKNRSKLVIKNSTQLSRILSINSRERPKRLKSASYFTKNGEIVQSNPLSTKNGNKSEKTIEINPHKASAEVEKNTGTGNLTLIENLAKKHESFLN